MMLFDYFRPRPQGFLSDITVKERRNARDDVALFPGAFDTLFIPGMKQLGNSCDKRYICWIQELGFSQLIINNDLYFLL